MELCELLLSLVCLGTAEREREGEGEKERQREREREKEQRRSICPFHFPSLSFPLLLFSLSYTLPSHLILSLFLSHSVSFSRPPICISLLFSVCVCSLQCEYSFRPSLSAWNVSEPLQIAIPMLFSPLCSFLLFLSLSLSQFFFSTCLFNSSS